MARRYPGPRKIRDRADLGVYARWAGDPVSWAGMPLPPRSRRIVEGSVIHVSGPAGDMDERATATRWNLPEPYRAVFVTRVRRPGFRSSPHSFCAVSVTSERAFARLSHVQQRGPRTRPWTCALRWRPTLRTSSTSGWGCECPPVARRNVREVLEQSVDDLGSLRIVDALTRAGWRRWRVRPVSWPCSGRDSLLTSLMALPVDRALPHRPPPRDGSGESVEEALRHDSRRRLLYGQSQRCPEGGRGLPAHWSRVVARARWRRRWCW